MEVWIKLGVFPLLNHDYLFIFINSFHFLFNFT